MSISLIWRPLDGMYVTYLCLQHRSSWWMITTDAGHLHPIEEIIQSCDYFFNFNGFRYFVPTEVYTNQLCSQMGPKKPFPPAWRTHWHITSQIGTTTNWQPKCLCDHTMIIMLQLSTGPRIQWQQTKRMLWKVKDMHMIAIAAHLSPSPRPHLIRPHTIVLGVTQNVSKTTLLSNCGLF